VRSKRAFRWSNPIYGRATRMSCRSREGASTKRCQRGICALSLSFYKSVRCQAAVWAKLNVCLIIIRQETRRSLPQHASTLLCPISLSPHPRCLRQLRSLVSVASTWPRLNFPRSTSSVSRTESRLLSVVTNCSSSVQACPEG